MHTTQEDLSGTVIAERFRLERALGSGGFGVVYAALDVASGERIALKLLHARHLQRPEVAKRFEREARAASQLTHPHTIRVRDFGRSTDGHMYIGMELLHGRELGEFLFSEGKLSEARVVAIGLQLFGALAEAHRCGIIHRDLKPANIMVLDRSVQGAEQAAEQGAPADFIKVLDFGIAKLGGQETTGLTGTGQPLGTASHMSPEQCYGRTLDTRSDQYSAGVVLYQLLTGRCPFEAEEPMGYLLQHATVPPPDVRELADDNPVSDGMAELVHRMLAKTPEERFPSTDDVVAALEGLDPHAVWTQRVPAVLPEPDTDATIEGIPAPRRPAWRWIAGGVGLGVIAAVAAILAVPGEAGDKAKANPAALVGKPDVLSEPDISREQGGVLTTETRPLTIYTVPKATIVAIVGGGGIVLGESPQTYDVLASATIVEVRVTADEHKTTIQKIDASTEGVVLIKMDPGPGVDRREEVQKPQELGAVILEVELERARRMSDE